MHTQKQPRPPEGGLPAAAKEEEQVSLLMNVCMIIERMLGNYGDDMFFWLTAHPKTLFRAIQPLRLCYLLATYNNHSPR